MTTLSSGCPHNWARHRSLLVNTTLFCWFSSISTSQTRRRRDLGPNFPVASRHDRSLDALSWRSFLWKRTLLNLFSVGLECSGLHNQEQLLSPGWYRTRGCWRWHHMIWIVWPNNLWNLHSFCHSWSWILEYNPLQLYLLHPILQSLVCSQHSSV
jgi:hypothetical protein